MIIDGTEDDLLNAFVEDTDNSSSSSSTSSSSNDFEAEVDTSDDEKIANDISDRIAGTQSMDEPAKTTEAKEPKVDKTKQTPEDKGQPKPNEQELRPAGNGLFFDGNHNLVDRTGKIIAAKGSETRMYLDKTRTEAQLTRVNKELETTKTELDKHRLLGGYAQQSGLNTDELASAVRMAARVKSGDILSVAKDVVAMAAARGHNITEILGSEVGDSVDMKALRHLVTSELAPIRQRYEAESQQEQQAAQAQQAYDTFVQKHEFADIHGEDIVNVAKRENVDLSTAYIRLRSFADRNRLDFSRPLGPQAQARAEALRNGQGEQRPSASDRRPLPNGARSGAAPAAKPAGEMFADPTDDWGSIIRAVQEASN
jgi:hypothetical protein